MKQLSSNPKCGGGQVLSLIFCLFFVTACTAAPRIPSSTPPYTPEIVEYIEGDTYAILTSIPERAAYADLIVIGEVQPLDDFFNCVYDSPNPSRESQDLGLYGVCELHEVKIERYLKGEGPETILMAVGEGSFPFAGTSSLTRDDILDWREKGKGTHWNPLTPDYPYVIFIDKPVFTGFMINNRYHADDVYIRAAGLPWIFDLGDPNQIVPTAIPEDISGYVSEGFPPLTLDEMIALINTPYEPPVYPYDNPRTPDEAYPGPLSAPGDMPFPYPAP